MTFSSTPVIVNPGDTVELRYPTPDTWETTVNFQVQIGEGIDNVTVGTKIPDATPTYNGATFVDNFAYLGQTGTSPTIGIDPDFERNTFYYSSTVTVDNIELRVPIKIETSAFGPKAPNFPNLAQAAYRINDAGPWVTEANSSVPITGTTTVGSKTITGVNTTGMAVGMYVESNRIGGEIINISGNSVTVVAEATSSGTTTGDVYFTVQEGDVIRVRIQTEDWYTTNTNVTITISDSFWTGQNPLIETWSITTRPQRLDIDSLNPGTFNDYIDRRPSEFGTYKQTSILMSGIDSDAIVDAVSAGDTQISADGVSWSQSVPSLTLNETLFIRTLVGADYTTKTSGSVTVSATPGNTLPGGFENNTSGTFGVDPYDESQTNTPQTDEQQIWTEVDRYPDPISLSPIFTGSDTVFVSGPTAGDNYTTGIKETQTITGSGTGLTFNITEVTPLQGAVAAGIIEERGVGYNDGDIVRVLDPGSGNNYEIELVQYRTVTVSTDNTISNAEPDRYYYANIPISGLGTEYAVNAYSDLETPILDNGSAGVPLYNTSPALGTGGVQISVQITQGTGRIRKNNTGTWETQIYVEEGDLLNFRLKSASAFDATVLSSIEFLGPAAAGPLGNPTNGPNPPSFADLFDTLTVTTRQARVRPKKIRATPVFDAEPNDTVTADIKIDGIDANTQIRVVNASAFANAQVQGSGSFGAFDSISATDGTAQVRLTIGDEGSTRFVTYRVGSLSDFEEDTFVVSAKKSGYTYVNLAGFQNNQFVLPTWVEEFDAFIVGAGGGAGGDDLPASDGGGGAPGNVIIGTMNIPPSDWINENLRIIEIWGSDGGEDGQNFAELAQGGAGGEGYTNGGDGGNGSASENSGGGGGGGGSSALIKFDDGTVLGVAGGGGGGGGFVPEET